MANTMRTKCRILDKDNKFDTLYYDAELIVNSYIFYYITFNLFKELINSNIKVVWISFKMFKINILVVYHGSQ